MIHRYLTGPITEHLHQHRQIVFLMGPRQVGKTTLAKGLLVSPIEGVNYFNWDNAAHRKLLTSQVFRGKVDLTGDEKKVIVFDEIHKYPRWKNTIKGLFDQFEPHTRWIITGSAALDVYKKGQDSLVGRSFSYHLCPLSVAELSEGASQKKLEDIFNDLINFSGFPEPYLKKNGSFLSRWRTSRLDKLINQDLGAVENLRHLPLVEQLMYLLPERVGSPLSINNLREDLEVHFATVKHWIGLLERVFYGFRILPFSGKMARTLKKEAKWYLWDWTEIEDPGLRFENLTAVHFLKYVHYMNDLGLDDLSLFYLRDKEKHEVDFLICRKRKPYLLVECKKSDDEPSPSLVYFASRLRPERVIQLVQAPITPLVTMRSDIKVEIISAASFLKELV